MGFRSAGGGGRTGSLGQQGACGALSAPPDPRVQARQLSVLRVKEPTWGQMKEQLPGSPTLSPSVLYPHSAPIHSFWSPVPVKMLSLPRFEHAFCCRKMKTMQPDVFLFLLRLPEARAKCVAPVRGAALPAVSSTFGFLQGALFRLTCLCQNLWALPGPAPPEGRKSGRNSRGRQTHLEECRGIRPVQVSSEAPPL